LEARRIEIEGRELNVEIADTEKLQAKGLMGRTTLNDGQGMLFIYPYSQTLSFWMKNTLIPLSIGFFDSKKVLFQILDMPVETDPSKPRYSYRSWQIGMYALEVPMGWFQRMKIEPGAKFSFLD
jgi:uncharacterized membrane protein (UPF0127 family)